MTTPQLPPAPASAPASVSGGGSRGRALGMLLVAPMLLATLLCIGWPALDTLLRATSVVDGASPIGQTRPADWSLVLATAGGFAAAGLGQIVPVAIAGSLIAIPIAQALAVGAVAARIGTAALLVLPMPLAAATWWFLPAAGDGLEADASAASGAAAAGLLPTVVGVAAVVLVPVVRAGLRLAPTLLAVLGVGAATASIALQSSVSGVLSRGQAATLPAASYDWTFRRFELADGAALDLLVLVALGVLGVVVVALLILLRAEVVRVPVPRARPLAATIGSLVAIVVALAAVAMPAMLAASGAPPADVLAGLLPAAVGTWVPALLAAALAAALAVSAAIGIAWHRPLGAASAWLLLPFAPALLVTATPLVASASLRRVELGAGLLPLVPTVVVSVPLLVVLTLLVAGMRRAGRLDGRTLAWSALGAFAVLAATNAQALEPARVLALVEESSVVMQLMVLGSLGGAAGGVGLAALISTLPVGLVLAPLVVVALSAVRGATLVTGDEPVPTPSPSRPATPPQQATMPPAPQSALRSPAPPQPGTRLPPPA